jgi:hypothetical protein
MKTNKIKDAYITVIQDILGQRLPVSRSWNNVSMTNDDKEYEIRWHDPKKWIEPEAKKDFCSRGGSMHLNALRKELRGQLEKLQDDRLGQPVG